MAAATSRATARHPSSSPVSSLCPSKASPSSLPFPLRPCPNQPLLRSHLRLSSSASVAAASSFADLPYPSSDDVFAFDDKPREECGVFAIVGDPEAAQMCYLGLHALQHRGQEGAGIVSSDGASLHSCTGLGLVSEVFSQTSKLEPLVGSAAIGHNRYSTAGATSALANVQPFVASYRFGQLAVAHNGNLVNYHSLRYELESRGSIFSTTSDTEVILHLIATSTTRPLLARIIEACRVPRGRLLPRLAHRGQALRRPRPPWLPPPRHGSPPQRRHRLRLRNLRSGPYQRRVRAGGEPRGGGRRRRPRHVHHHLLPLAQETPQRLRL
ncbi:unnamed protein product [Musa banksii]